MKKIIAIVGGGMTGLGCIAVLKEEGIESICFEKTDTPGGTWFYREESVVGVPSIMPTTIINHSKELGAISIFPPDKKYNNYMKHTEIYDYFMSFFTKHDVFKHVKLNSEVIHVKPNIDYEQTGRWVVTVKDTLTETVSSNIYDGVIVCVGFNNIPKWPAYKDQERFKGKLMHTHSLKGVMPYKNKKVVVVGMGCSGLDAAVEVSIVAEKTYLSTRSGAHVISCVGPRGYPIDYVMVRRYILAFLDLLPSNFLSWILENLLTDPKFNSRLYFVKPQSHILSKDPAVNDHIASKLLSGSVIQKQDITEFTEDGVVFEGDSSVTEADVVIMATGYIWQFPFLETGVIDDDKSTLNFYKLIWPPNLKHATLAFVGYLLPFGPGFPLGEMQCRYVAHVFSGKGKLPTKEEMMQDISNRNQKNAARYSYDIDIVIVDELSVLFGVKPNFLKMFFTDPKLFFALMFGPCLSYQYRLQGPHAWSGARDAIMTAEERVHWPLKRFNVDKVESGFLVFLKKFIIWLLPFF